MPKAIYEGIYREIRSRIINGTYAFQEMLPTEAEPVSATDAMPSRSASSAAARLWSEANSATFSQMRFHGSRRGS